MFVEADSAEACLNALREGPEPYAWIAGELCPRDGGEAVILENQNSWASGG